MKLGLVVADFNEGITEEMEEKAMKAAEDLGVEIEKVFHVPGTYDMPLAVKKACKIEKIDAVVTIGAVITGDTKHDEVITHATAKTLQDLSIQYEKPVTLGVSGPGMTREEAKERIIYAKRAIESAVKTTKSLK